MSKPKCLFIDHKYHSTTSSTRFLMDIMSEKFTVEVLYLDDFTSKSFDRILKTNAELYLAFQYDFIAPFLLSNNKKVIVIPMYDGTGEMHPLHWMSMKGSLFLNFSKHLHNVHTGLGLNSLYARYYPDPSNYPKFDPKTNDPSSVFFWERHPQLGLSIDWLAYQLNRQNFGLKKIHIHQAPDPGQYTKRNALTLRDIFPGKYVTNSTWYKSKEKFLEEMSCFGIYIAPRKAEGIGFSFIDAMACGMVVLAYDKATMNEYITHGVNGILFNDNLPNIRTIDLDKIRKKSIADFSEGRQNWLNFLPKIHLAIDDYINTKSRNILSPITPELASEISHSFFSRQDVYKSMIYDLIISSKENHALLRGHETTKLSTLLPKKLKNRPVLNQVLIHMYSKRKKIL